ncbi:hypothetical protein INT45_008277 [Circinella minor]|uniref:Uncharacterized protein n=1 Tax=Circinella minor TaxID=1195481 RepID=A0A8H7RRF0_9FUNG|nr:hypothetical protein INT45_008277 [Circinella minor]
MTPHYSKLLFSCATNIKVEFFNSGLSEQEATNLTTFVEKCKRITSVELANTAHFKKATWRRLLKSIAYTKKNLDVFLPAAAIKPSVLASFHKYKRQFRLIVKDFDNVVDESDETEDEVNGYNEVFASDEDDDVSLSRILKRQDIDCYDTPVHVKRTVQNVKDTLKTSMIQAGRARLRNHPMNNFVEIPTGLDKIVKKGCAYHKLLRQIEADEYLGVTTSREDKIEELVKCIASQLTEAILLGVNSWIYLISFDVFLHGEPNMDDCARGNSGFFSLPTVRILNPSEGRATWKELVINYGSMEILITAAVCGSLVGRKRCVYLGPSVPESALNLIGKDTFTICVPLDNAPYISSIRLLRDYTRLTANKRWSFSSEEFSKTGFSLCHPIAMDKHTTRLNMIKPDAASIASILVSIVVRRYYSKVDQQLLLHKLLKTNEISNALTEHSSSTATTIEQVSNLKYDKTRPLGRIIKILLLIDQRLGDNDSVILADLLCDKEFSLSVVNIYKSIIAPAMKKAHKSLYEKYKLPK